MPESILDWGLKIILNLQAAFAISGPMNGITFLGSEEFFLIFFPLLYWAVDNKLRLQVAIFFAASIVVNSAAKIAIHEPRPFWLDPNVQLLAEPDGLFGNPSGHSQHTLVIWSTIAAHYGKRWLWAAAGLLVLLVGVSRVYLGVHFPTDVLIGWFVGALLLGALLRLQTPAVVWFQRQTWQRRIFSVWLLSLAGIAIGAIVAGITQAAVTVPAAWLALATAKAPGVEILPFTITDFITICGTMFGFLGGYVWLETGGGYDPAGPLWQRLVRYLLGAVVVVVIWAGLDALFTALAGDETLLGFVLRYVRYTVVGLWVGALAPRLFIKVGLAEASK